MILYIKDKHKIEPKSEGVNIIFKDMIDAVYHNAEQIYPVLKDLTIYYRECEQHQLLRGNGVDKNAYIINLPFISDFYEVAWDLGISLVHIAKIETEEGYDPGKEDVKDMIHSLFPAVEKVIIGWNKALTDIDSIYLEKAIGGPNARMDGTE